jgi:hypothetical protein
VRTGDATPCISGASALTEARLLESWCSRSKLSRSSREKRQCSMGVRALDPPNKSVSRSFDPEKRFLDPEKKRCIFVLCERACIFVYLRVVTILCIFATRYTSLVISDSPTRSGPCPWLTATSWVAALLADLHAASSRVSPSGQFGALVFRHLSIQLELRYLGMERQTVTFITLRLIIDLGGAHSTWLRRMLTFR